MVSAAKSNNAGNKHCLGPEGYSRCHSIMLCCAMCCTCLCDYTSVCFLSMLRLLMTSMAPWLLSTNSFCLLISACPQFSVCLTFKQPKERGSIVPLVRALKRGHLCSSKGQHSICNCASIRCPNLIQSAFVQKVVIQHECGSYFKHTSHLSNTTIVLNYV